MRIAIVGAGAMGCLYGGTLACVTDVWLIDPWRDHVDAIRGEGLHIVSSAGDNVIQIPATTNPADVGLVDLAIVFVKSSQTPWAAEVAKSILTPNGLALTLQNGLGNGEMLAKALGPERVWQGVTSHGATMLGPGRIRHAGAGPTYLELRPEIAAVAEEFAALLGQAEFDVRLSGDLNSLIWGKLVINVGINAIVAILRVPNGVLGTNEAGATVMDMAVEEAVAVANAKGIKLPYADPVAHVRQVAFDTGANRASMLQDVLRGSPTEVDVINGAIVREAARVGLATPVNATLTSLVKAIETTKAERIA
ncbi:MAG: ketopantoate reductase family protein [Chloroflexota bacterium]